MPDLPSSLSSIVRTDPRLRAAYAEGAGIYRIIPAGVAIPGSLAELQSLVRLAAAEGLGLIPRGAGSGIPGNTVGEGIIVDLREAMPRVLAVDPLHREAVTSANVTQQELNVEAATHGLRLPPDPSSARWATLGGMVSTNAAGARTVRYGAAREWVTGLGVVTADGEAGWLLRSGAARRVLPDAEPDPGASLEALSRFYRDAAPRIRFAAETVAARFPRVRKNTAGYALDRWISTEDDVDLLVGAEGTLGLITTIRWRLAPVPAARSSLKVALSSLDDLETAVRALVALDPSAVELLDRTFLELVAQAGLGGQPSGALPEATLLVEFERETAAAARGVAGDAVRSLRDVATDVETALTPEEEHRLWELRHAASPILARLPVSRRSMQVIEDGCVPLPRLGAYVGAIRQGSAEWGIPVVIFGHAGDGNVHVNALPETTAPDWEVRLAGLYRDVNAAAIRLGGTVSGEHGDGRLRAPFLEAQYGTEVMDLFRLVKRSFDPRGILNPGVKLGSEPPLSHLKVGRDVAEIPADIGWALREIERTGGYARSRGAIAEP
ncbi:MAG: FAD-binding oxidoreductase [Gemmatimonadetes bacterium]|nr:FAD-binding oxidoreductase [Gemmatimonadota bacterium]